jgi:hypothetical protein
MDFADAIKAAEYVRCNEVLGLHFDTFPPIQIDHRQAIGRFKSAGKTLHLLEPGQAHVFD